MICMIRRSVQTEKWLVLNESGYGIVAIAIETYSGWHGGQSDGSKDPETKFYASDIRKRNAIEIER